MVMYVIVRLWPIELYDVMMMRGGVFKQLGEATLSGLNAHLERTITMRP